MPETTCAATRVGLASPGTSAAKITKLAEPSATSVLVRSPASRLRHCLSKPMSELRPPATARLIAASAMEIAIACHPIVAELIRRPFNISSGRLRGHSPAVVEPNATPYRQPCRRWENPVDEAALPTVSLLIAALPV